MICLTFDIEEFDLPIELGYSIALDRQIEISRQGTEAILDLLKKYGIRGTFFVTVNFCRQSPDTVLRIIQEGHELASHGVNHSSFEKSDLIKSKEALERFSGKAVAGFRMPRMKQIAPEDIADAGYKWESSLNPTYIPGRYNNFSRSRTPFREGAILQIPSSVSPIVRFPLFWLSAHVLPLNLFLRIAQWTLRKDKSLVLYFHPWEFYNLKSLTEYKLPFLILRRAGRGMCEYLSGIIRFFINHRAQFGTLSDLYTRIQGK